MNYIVELLDDQAEPFAAISLGICDAGVCAAAGHAFWTFRWTLRHAETWSRLLASVEYQWSRARLVRMRRLFAIAVVSASRETNN